MPEVRGQGPRGAVAGADPQRQQPRRARARELARCKEHRAAAGKRRGRRHAPRAWRKTPSARRARASSRGGGAMSVPPSPRFLAGLGGVLCRCRRARGGSPRGGVPPGAGGGGRPPVRRASVAHRQQTRPRGLGAEGAEGDGGGERGECALVCVLRLTRLSLGPSALGAFRAAPSRWVGGMSASDRIWFPCASMEPSGSRYFAHILPILVTSGRCLAKICPRSVAC